ncbi:MAG TPA: hypothetical protein VG674_06315 [Amycolatopsis sp.]|nr:hypothetical protein [Amycolatopsis sp.]
MRPAPDAAGQQPVTLVLRPISSPLPLGFLALFTGSVLLSAVQLRWIPGTQSHFVAIGVLGIVVPLQLVSCVFGFLGRDPAFGTGMGVLSGTWAAAGVSLLAAPPGQVEPALGVVLITAATALLVPTVVGALGKVLVALVMGGASARFAITGVYELTGSSAWEHSCGIMGIVVAAAAGYAALAFELEGAPGAGRAAHRPPGPQPARGLRSPDGPDRRPACPTKPVSGNSSRARLTTPWSRRCHITCGNTGASLACTGPARATGGRPWPSTRCSCSSRGLPCLPVHRDSTSSTNTH